MRGEDTEERLRNERWSLGMAFQLIDDMPDFEAAEAALANPVGNDLKEGKINLPLIRPSRRAWRTSEPKTRRSSARDATNRPP